MNVMSRPALSAIRTLGLTTAAQQAFPVVVLAPLPLWWQPGGSHFFGVPLFGNSSESCEEAGIQLTSKEQQPKGPYGIALGVQKEI